MTTPILGPGTTVEGFKVQLWEPITFIIILLYILILIYLSVEMSKIGTIGFELHAAKTVNQVAVFVFALAGPRSGARTINDKRQFFKRYFERVADAANK